MNVIILGLGSFGIDSLRRLQSSTAPGRLTLATLHPVEGAAGFSFRVAGGLTLIECPATVNDNRDHGAFLDWCASKFADRRSGIGPQTDRRAIVTIADRDDPSAIELGVGLARLLDSGLPERSNAGPIELTGIFRLPPGDTAFCDKSAYHRHFFVSESHPGNAADGMVAGEVAAVFASLLAEPSFDTALGDIMEVRRARAAGVGLAGLTHPIERLVTEESDRFIRELVNDGLLSGAGELFYRQAAEYLKRRDFTTAALRDAVVAVEEGAAADSLIIDIRRFAGTPLSSWLEKIDGHIDYLGRERLPRIIGRLQRNLDRLGETEAAALAAELDDLMTEPGALDKAERFLDRLRDRTAALAEDIESQAAAETGKLKDPGVFRADLVRRLKGHPDAVALAARGWLLVPLIYFFGLEFTRVLGAFPDGYINPAYLPSPFVSGAVAAVLAGIFIFVFFQRAEASLRDSRSHYIDSLVAGYKEAIDRAGWRLLAKWLSVAEVEEDAGEALHSWSGALFAEQNVLTELRKRYLRSLGKPGAAGREGAFDRDQPLFFPVEPPIRPRYKQGRYEREDEAARYAASHHREWRLLGEEQVAEALSGFARAGLTFVDDQTLDKSLLESTGDHEHVSELLDRLRHDSRPPPSPTSARSDPVVLAVLPGGRASPLAADPAFFKEAGVVDISRPHQLIYVQLAFVPAAEEDAA